MLQNAKRFFTKHGVLVLSIVLVAAVCLSFCLQKNGFFIDEQYSYGLSNSQNTPFFSDLKGSLCGHTFSGQDAFDYLTVNSQDAFDYASVYYNQTQDVHPPLFYFLLHTVSSVFQNSFSKWIGIGLNIVFFVLTILLLYHITKNLFASKGIALCAVFLYGLNTMAISTLLMVRMYMLLTCLTVLLVFVLVKLNQKQVWYRYIFVAVTIFSGLLTQYYYVFYAFFLCGFYCIYLLRKKQIKNTVIFALSALLGVVAFYLVFPSCIHHLLGDSAVSGVNSTKNLKSFADCIIRIVTFGGAMAYYSLPAVFVAIGSVFVCLRNRKGLKEKYKNKLFNFVPLLYIVPAILAFFVVSIISPYTVTRYIYNLVPVFILGICFLLNLAKHSLDEKKPNKTAITAGLLAISVVCSLFIQPSNVYAEYKNQPEQLAPYTGQPCVYVTLNKDSGISSDLDMLSTFDSFHVVDPENMQTLSGYVDTLENYTNVVVHIATVVKEVDHNLLLSSLCDTFGMESSEVLFNRATSTTYILSGKNGTN